MDFLQILYPTLLICAPVAIVLIIGVVVSALWLKLMDRNIRACPECGAKAAGTIVNTQEIVLSNHVDHRGRQAVRIKETKVIDHYQCDFCEYTWERSFKRRERVPIKAVLRR